MMELIKRQIMIESKGLVEISKVKTARGTSFGRGISERDLGEGPTFFMFMASDFEIKLLKANLKTSHYVVFDL